MNFLVTFTNVFENCESEEQVYDALLEYLHNVVKYNDLTAFEIVKTDGKI